MARRRNTRAGAGETVLVVDDQEETLLSVRMLLEREGYRVLSASDGPSALNQFRCGEIALVIVDYFMPGMTGEELVSRLRDMDEDVQILLQTGYSGQKPPLAMLRSLAIQGYHDKTDGPDRLLVWVEVALKAYRQIQKIREVERLKSEILANVSHELRTPVQIILGYTEVLTESPGALPSDSLEVVERVRQHATGLAHLISDFLAFARSDSRTGLPPFGPVSLMELEAECRELVSHLLDGKQVTFHWNVPEDLPTLHGDRRQISVILRNLLSNSAKFTNRGEIRVDAHRSEDEIHLRISDTGIGIAPEHHETVFEPFRQVDGSETRNFGGAGLGLALVRKLAERMHAKIVLESALGIGTTFDLAFPVVSSQPDAERLDSRLQPVLTLPPPSGV